MERTKIHECEGSRPYESRQDEEKKGRSGAPTLGQSDDEMERLSKMVGSLQRLDKLCEKRLRICAKEPWEGMRTT